MPRRLPDRELRQAQRLFHAGAAGSMTDAELLDRFRSGRGETAEAAFEALVTRHGSMVLRVCRGVVRDTHDAEDAFQAVFLVLANRAGSVRRGDSVASWLFGVAHRVSSRLRRDAARRRALNKVAAERTSETCPPGEPVPDWEILHEEIAGLPERLRSPVVLCYLQGQTYDATASQLGLTPDAVRGRLARARERLSRRLHDRGLATPVGMAVGLPAQLTPLAVPAALIDSTIRIALGFAAGNVAAALARKVALSMILSKLKVAVAVLCLGVGVGLGTWQTFGGSQPARIPPAPDRPIDLAVAAPLSPPRSDSTVSARAAEAEPLKPGGNFELTVVGPGGKAVPGALVEFRADPQLTPPMIRRGTLVNRLAYGKIVRADGEGRIAVNYAKVPDRMTLSVETPGYGPYWARWSRIEHSEAIPARFTFDLDAAWTAGGVVVGPDGKPVVGATVHPWIEYKKRPGDNSQLLTGTEIKTDAQGRWRFENVPDGLTEVRVTVNQPEYRPFNESLARGKYAVSPGEEPSARMTLDRGLTVVGSVVDDRGRPIAGATVRTKFHNEIRKAITGPDGSYRLEGCEARPTRIVVSAPGKAFDMRQVTVSPEMEPVRFVMAPGRTVRVKVLNHDGKPEARARIFFQQWRGEQVEYFEFDEVDPYANADGVWTWNEAPVDGFAADISPRGSDSMQLARQPLEARAEEFVFKLPPALVVSGRVIDAETREPIQKFRVIEGGRWANSDRPHWSDRNGFDGSDGTYRVRNTRLDGVFLIRIEAEGYEAATSREVRGDEGAVTLDFALKRGKGVTLQFLTPDLKPASGVRVALGIEGAQIVIQDGDLAANQTYADVRTTDADGRVAFPARDKPFLLIALHPSGYARLNVDGSGGDFVRQVRLEPWAAVEGTFRIGPRPAANVRLLLDPIGFDDYGRGGVNLTIRSTTTTSPQGRYRLDRVFAGEAQIRRDNTIRLGEGASEKRSSIPARLTLAGGQTTTFDFGGTGRVVVGKLSMPPGAAEPSDWSFAGINGHSTETGPDGSNRNWFSATVVRDATFRIDDLPPGSYKMSVRMQRDRDNLLSGFAFEVPPADPANSQALVDLGTIAVSKPDPRP